MKFVVRHLGEEMVVEIERDGSEYRIKIDERSFNAEMTVANRFLSTLRLDDGAQYLVVHHRDGNAHEVSFGDRTVCLELFDPLTLKRTAREDQTGGGGTVKAAMPGRIVRILVAEGDTVEKGAGLLILEAMKMENEMTSPRDGVVRSLLVQQGQTVEGGTELVIVD